MGTSAWVCLLQTITYRRGTGDAGEEGQWGTEILGKVAGVGINTIRCISKSRNTCAMNSRYQYLCKI